MPDESKLPEYHYLHVRNFPQYVDGKLREVDDFQPRVQMKKALADGTLFLQNEESVREFCNRFIVERQLLTKHIQINKIKKTKKMKKRKAYSEAETKKQYEDFDWFTLKDSDEIKKTQSWYFEKKMHHNLKGIIKFKRRMKVQVIETTLQHSSSRMSLV